MCQTAFLAILCSQGLGRFVACLVCLLGFGASFARKIGPEPSHETSRLFRMDQPHANPRSDILALPRIDSAFALDISGIARVCGGLLAPVSRLTFGGMSSLLDPQALRFTFWA